MAKLRYEWGINKGSGEYDWADNYREAMREAKKAARASKQDIYVDVMDDPDNPDAEDRDYYYVVSPTGDITRK